MSKNKSISDLVTELQEENNRLKGLEKLLDKAVKLRLGMSISDIEKALGKRSKMSRFENEISKYYELKSDEEKEEFITIICCENMMNYYRKKIASFNKITADNTPVDRQG